MNILNKYLSLAFAVVFMLGLSACTAEVGSDKWCTNMKEKPKGEWTANEASDFAKHCIMKQ